jgi:serine/threonine-protein kinase
MEVGFRPGAVLLDKYRVESVLGRGGMGIVLRVTHLHLGEELAIKILLPEAADDPEVRVRFLREAQSAVRLRGEHVTRVSDVGMLPEGVPYIAMEYLRGVDLAGELGRRGMLPPGDTVDYVLQVCEALAEAHALGIVHRDIKPGNLFLTYRPDGTPLVKVLDFGISKVPIAGPGLLTRTDTVMGTPGYMSPEQMKASKDVDSRSDIWAVGIVLYECLNSRRPFDAESFSAVVFKVATEPPPPMVPRIPRGLQAVVLRCLEKDRAARFPSIAELAAALAPFARDGRAAGIVVERTSAMLRDASSPIPQNTHLHQLQAQTATTLRKTTGVRTTSKRLRYAAIGTMSLIGMFVALSQVASTNSRRTDDSADPPNVKTATRSAEPTNKSVAMSRMTHEAVPAPLLDAGLPIALARSGHSGESAELLADASAPPADVQVAEAATAAPTPHMPTKSDDESQNESMRELQNASLDAEARNALRTRNLRQAQEFLKRIARNSAYFQPLINDIEHAEDLMIEEVGRKAQQLANVHYCAALKRYIQILSTGNTGTERVILAASTVKCVDKSSAPPLE